VLAALNDEVSSTKLVYEVSGRWSTTSLTCQIHILDNIVLKNHSKILPLKRESKNAKKISRRRVGSNHRPSTHETDEKETALRSEVVAKAKLKNAYRLTLPARTPTRSTHNTNIWS
jgi:hypothetical protein